MRIGKIQIDVKASRWPWQPGYNWRGMENSRAPLNAGGARFGGGWRYKLGVDVGGSTVIVNLIFGMVRIRVFDWVAEERAAADIKARIEALTKSWERVAAVAPGADWPF